MKINTTLKILMCSSALVFAGVGTASAHQHEEGEAAASQMKDKAMDHAMDKAEGAVMEKAEDTVMEKAEDAVMDKAKGAVMDKAKGMAKEKVLGTAGSGIAGKMEHQAKEKAMDHAMDKAEGKMMDHAKHKAEGKMMDHATDKAEGKMMDHAAGEHTMKDGSVMSGKEHGMEHKMSAPAAMQAAPAATKPMKLLSFDEALAVCRANANANLQACVDERTGQGALRRQMNGS